MNNVKHAVLPKHILEADFPEAPGANTNRTDLNFNITVTRSVGEIVETISAHVEGRFTDEQKSQLVDKVMAGCIVKDGKVEVTNNYQPTIDAALAYTSKTWPEKLEDTEAEIARLQHKVIELDAALLQAKNASITASSTVKQRNETIELFKAANNELTEAINSLEMKRQALRRKAEIDELQLIDLTKKLEDANAEITVKNKYIAEHKVKSYVAPVVAVVPTKEECPY